MDGDKEDKLSEGLTRAFIALDFDDEVIKEIARVQEEVEKIKFTGKLTELENTHLTLKFLGEIDEKKLNEVRVKLKTVKFKEVEGKLGEIGTFNIRGKPRIVWIKVNGPGVWELQKQIDGKMGEIGFKKEERFMSHLTIARIKYVNDKKGFNDLIKNFGVREIEFKVRGFKLMKSELKKLGPVYTCLEEYKCE